MTKWQKEKWPDFEPDEIACRCGARCTHKDPALISPTTMDLLQAIRDSMGRPIIVLSGLRCVGHNMNVGGDPNSRHITGQAVDFTFHDIDPLGFAHLLATEFGWRGGIGAYPSRGFVHVDSDLSKSSVTGVSRNWIFRNKKYEMVDFRDDHSPSMENAT